MDPEMDIAAAGSCNAATTWRASGSARYKNHPAYNTTPAEQYTAACTFRHAARAAPKVAAYRN